MQVREDAPMRAAIDIGSNTLQLVIARCQANNLDIQVDEEDVVRLGQDVNERGRISAAKRDEVLSILKRYKALAVEHHVEEIFVLATEAVRKARNSRQFLNAVERVIGVKAQVIDGDIEAMLTFYGASYEYLCESKVNSSIAVMDLGGGSTELVMALHGRVNWLTSLPIGSGWLHDRYMRSDPPTEDERDLADVFLKTYLKGIRIKKRPGTLIVTGGSAKTLLHMARTALDLEEQQANLSFMDVVRCDGILGSLPSTEITQRYDVSEKRAGLLPSGTRIIQKIMNRLQVSEIRVSTHGIREGLLLTYARYGERWHEELEAQRQHLDKQKMRVDSCAEMITETFAETGRRLLNEWARTMCDWRDDVLKNEDIEAVHKMRVASRRLRAMLDAYESICEPKPFKAAYRDTKAMADILGKARDTDVMIQNLQMHIEDAPTESKEGIDWFITRLRSYRDEHQKALEEYLHTFDERAFLRLINACIPKGGKRYGKG